MVRRRVVYWDAAESVMTAKEVAEADSWRRAVVAAVEGRGLNRKVFFVFRNGGRCEWLPRVRGLSPRTVRVIVFK